MIRTEMLEVMRENNMKKMQGSNRCGDGEAKKTRLQRWRQARQKKLMQQQKNTEV